MMKKNTMMFCKSKFIWSVVIMTFLLFYSVIGKAQDLVGHELDDIKPSDQKYNSESAWTARIENNKLIVRAILADVDCDEDDQDDFITQFSMSLDEKVIFSIANFPAESPQSVWDNQGLGKLTISDNGCVDEARLKWYWNIKPDGVIKGDISYEFEANAVLTITYTLTKDFLRSGTVALDGFAIASFNSITQKFKSLNLNVNKLPTMPSVTATQGCSSVKLSWGKLDLSSYASSQFKYEIYKGTELVAKDIDVSSTSYEIKDITESTTFRIKLLWVGEEIEESTVEGSPIDQLPVPIDLQASATKCDGSIDLKWQWTQSSPTSFIVYSSTSKDKDFVALPDVISGVKRSFNFPGLERGKKYYFKISAKGGKCPLEEGPASGDAVMGLSPLDPVPPLETTMKLLQGIESGVLLSWKESQWEEPDFKEGSTQKYIITRKDLKKGTETKIEIPISDLYSEFVEGKTKDTIKKPNGFLLSYKDKEVSTCESYSYKISAFNICKTSASVFFYEQDNLTNDKISITNIDLPRVFLGKNLETSKGYYGNLVQLNWNTNENSDFVGVYKIYRRVLGSLIQPELLQTLDKNARSWADNRSVSSMLYEYYIVAEADCGLEKLKSFPIENVIGKAFSQLKNIPGVGSDIGFRLPTATVTGNVTYVGGIAVPNVKVVAERDGEITGRALEFDGTSQYVKINPDAKKVNYSKTGCSASLWIKPKKLTGNQMLASLKDGFELKLDGSKVKVFIGGDELISKSDLIVSDYTHLFATCSSDSLVLYINGKKDISIKRDNVLPLLETSTESIYLGGYNYAGLIDEFRIYNTAVSAEKVQRDYSRLIASETPNLVGYWRFDEGVGPFVFDSSKENEVFHSLDGEITEAKWSSDVPSKEQLGFGGYTDKNGNYKIEGILYNGTGENFSITPTMTLSGAVHGFAPINRVLFLGEGKTTENSVDFIDQSSFVVTGSVRFNFDDNEGTDFKSSGSEGVAIWIDGTQQCMKDGKLIVTDNFGQFKVVVPIGKHFLEFRKEGHVFQENRFPSQSKGFYDFQDRLSGIEVLDNTKHKLVGCVVGGLIQGSKKLGFSSYKGKLTPEDQRVNNIGTAYFTLTSVDTKIKRKVTTDPETGEFEIQLPPMEYEFSDVKFLGKESDIDDDTVLFIKSELESVKLASEAAYKGVNETILAAGIKVTEKFNVEKRLIYRSIPSIVVLDELGYDFLPNKAQLDNNGTIIADKTQVGDKKVEIKDGKNVVNIPTKSLLYPLFSKGIAYETTIKGLETYTYYGEKPLKNPAFDEVPVLDGDITIRNSISARGDGRIVAIGTLNDDPVINFSGNTHQIKLSSNGSVRYSFVGGDPDFIKKADANDTFSKSMAITLKTGNYTVYWPEASDPSSTYKGYVLGEEELPGTDFITEAPAKVLTILRMPPGSKSSISIEKGSSTTKQVLSSTVEGGGASIALGGVYKNSVKVTAPVTGVTTEVSATEFSLMVEGNFSKFNNNTSTKTTVTSFIDKITISNEGSPFNKGDFFISESKNNKIGLAKTIKFIPSTNCIGCLGLKVKGDDGIEYRLDTGETYSESTLGSTKSLYSENHIKTVIIPKLESVRNTLFINEPNVYVSKINAGYLLYGTNNDDPRWDDDALWDKDSRGVSNGTDYRTTEGNDFYGSSYTFNSVGADIIKGVKLDKVRWYNDQIRAWNEILMNNEIEKWVAIMGRQPLENNISISSNVSFMRTVETDSLDVDIDSNDILAGASIKSENEFRVGGLGKKIVVTGSGSKKFSSSTSTTTANSLTTSYIIKDDDPYNVLNLNVYRGIGDNGPIFQILAGQTSCPFEREKELDITKKNLCYLAARVNLIPEDIARAIQPLEKSIADLKDELISLKIRRKSSDENCDSSSNPYACILAHILKGKIDNLQSKIDGIDKEINKIKEEWNYKKAIYENLLISFKSDKKPLLGNRTVQIQKPGLLVNGGDKADMRNVPSNKAAVFDLDLRNETELKSTKNTDIVEYLLTVAKKSNPDGLTVLLNGQSLVQPVYFTIPFGQQIRQTLTVLRGPKKYDYKDLTLLMMSPCDTSIIKTVKVDINYIPVCAEANIVSPGNKWTVNYDSRNKLAVKINGYDVNYQGFKGIKIQYKKTNESDSDWKLLETYYRDIASRDKAIIDLKEDNVNAPVLSSNDFIYNWDVTKLPDDLYDLRIQSICDGENNDVVFTSGVISGIIDRVNPTLFGAPQPSDGVLSAGDEIMLQFNEPINAGLLSPYNFDIRGVVQGGELRHPASIYFNGEQDYMEIPAGIQLNQRSFSVDFYAKRKRNGAETLLSQGSSVAQSFKAGFNSGNQFEVTVAGIKVATKKTILADDSWVHFAYAFDAVNKNAKLYVNGKLETFQENYLPDYQSIGSIVVGKDVLGNSVSFQGNMHELRFWGKALSEAQVNVAATQRMKSNEPGLLGNWRMEEAEGKLVEDIVRERHAQIITATWQVALKGNALITNAATHATISSPAYLNVSNFSMEFWFKGNNTKSATLLSTGRGDSQDGNINGWSIRANSGGLLEVWNNDHVFIASDTNYFDNQWHHFALVVNRFTNTVCFVDGNQQNTIESSLSGFSGFGGAALHLGEMGWIANDGTPKDGQPFEGALDEVRIWQGTRNALQIKRDMRYMLSGDEPGLDLYLPFDKYKTTMGIEFLVASSASSANSITAVKDNGIPAIIKQNVSYMQETPLVKLPRPVRKINFSYSANQDKIILTTEDPESILENVVLDVSVSNVHDLNGNTMRAPVTWTAYVDRNQVNWIESDKHFEIESGKGLTFETRIKNTSGKVYNYTIKNLPVWLKAIPSSGVLAPLASIPIVFTVDRDVNIGNYTQDIQLVTEFGFAEIMNLNLDVFKPLPADWMVTPSKYQFSMNFVAQLSINGDISRDPNDQVAAFVGDECRGIAKLRYVPATDNYQAYISVYSNNPDVSEKVEFRIWNASDGQVHRGITPTYNFESNVVKGSPIKPEILNAKNTLEYTYDLAKGWTWISTHLGDNISNAMIANDLLKSLKHSTDGYLIRSIDEVDNYSTKDSWLGTLTNNGGVMSGRGYKIFVTEADQFKYSGLLLKGDQVKINLVKGWNWIGYVGFKKLPINQALAGFAKVKDGDVIKSQFALAVYSGNTGWIGDLTYLSPGEGYMMRVGAVDGGSFNYPNLSYVNSGKNVETNVKTENRIDASYKYPSSMNAIAEVVGDDQSVANKLRAYVGNELRGEAVAVYNPIIKKQTYFMTIYGLKSNEKVRFEFLDHHNDKVSLVNETFGFKADDLIGNAKNPQLLTLVSTQTGNIEDNTILVYPIPFTNQINVKLAKGHSFKEIVLFDLQGRELMSKEIKSDQEDVVLVVKNISSGVYLLAMYDAEGNLLKTQRIIK